MGVGGQVGAPAGGWVVFEDSTRADRALSKCHACSGVSATYGPEGAKHGSAWCLKHMGCSRKTQNVNPPRALAQFRVSTFEDSMYEAPSVE